MAMPIASVFATCCVECCLSCRQSPSPHLLSEPTWAPTEAHTQPSSMLAAPGSYTVLASGGIKRACLRYAWTLRRVSALCVYYALGGISHAFAPPCV